MTLFRRITGSAVTSALFAWFAGAVWGLALSRALAESFLASPTFDLWPTLLVALVVAVVAMAVCLWLRSTGGILGGPLLLCSIYLFWPGVAPHVGWTLLSGSLALTALLVIGQVQGASLPYGRLVAVLLACTTLALYLRTLGPTVGQADTFEFQVVAPTLGVAHPTGYPLYILSGKLFSLLPFGNVAWRVNLTSAVFATAAAVFLHQMVYRLTYRPLVALIAALAFAFSRVFWSQAVVAEVYALHNLFVAVIVLVLIEGASGRRQEASSEWAAAEEKRSPAPLYALALLLGLSFTNHLTTALLLPAVGLALLFMHPRIGRRGSGASIWVAAGLFLLGLSLYLYIYLRWPMLHDGVWMSPGEFWRYITGQQFGGALRLDAWRTDPTRYQIVGRLLRESFGWPGLALGAIGLVRLATKGWRAALITLATFLAYVWYALSYYVPDVSVFLLPAHLVLAAWMGVGMAALIEIGAGRERGEGSGTKGAVSISISCLYLLPLWLLWTNLPLVDQSGEREAYIWGERVLTLPLVSGAAILADSARIAPLYYLQRIEDRRPDLDMLVLADEATYRAELDARLAAGQTVYLARYLPGLEGLYHLRSLGPLTEVGTAPLMEPPPLDRVLGVQFAPPTAQGESIELLGLTGPIPGPDRGAGLTLYWRANAPIGEVYHVRLRLVDNDGRVWWQDADAGRHAANNYYPTLVWRPGEVVADYHEIPLLASVPRGSPDGYTVQVGLFRPFSDAGLTAGGGEMWFPLIQLDDAGPGQGLAQTLPAPAHPLRARFTGPADNTGHDGPTLVGVDLPDIVTAGAPVELTLHWCSSDAVVQGHPALTWTDQQGISVEAQVSEIWGRSHLSLMAPSSPGEYRLRLGLTDQEGRPISARCGWLARPSDDCALATVQVADASATALASFDGKMLLLDVEGGVSALRPGQSVPLTLHWQGLQPMQEDYTVSVQLIGPEGRLHGQTDAWPVQGTLPTSQWSPGQHIADPYTVMLSADAPPGRYQVGVVVYLLATQRRLSLVDELGRATGDIAIVSELEVGER